MYCVTDVDVRAACPVVLVSLGNGRRAPASDMVRGRTDAEAAGHSRWKRKRCGYLRQEGDLRQEDDLDRCNCGEGEHGCNDGDVSGTGGRLQKRGGQLQRSKRGDAGQLGAVVPGRWRPREGRRREPVVVELSVLAAPDRVRTPVCYLPSAPGQAHCRDRCPALQRRQGASRSQSASPRGWVRHDGFQGRGTGGMALTLLLHRENNLCSACIDLPTHL